MNILILGATGFIGSAVALKLSALGHTVTGLGRDLAAARRRLPMLNWIEGDLRAFSDARHWTQLVGGIDAVVNCAGALQDTPRDDVHAVQDRAMRALYDAAKARPGLRIVQISAARSLAASGTTFIDSKLNADAALTASGIDHVILRPALVLGRNAHGGSALLRALAAMPLAMPLSYPDSIVETVSLDRVAASVADALDGAMAPGSDIGLIDSRTSLRNLVLAHRQWLGLPPVSVIAVPGFAAIWLSRLADLAGKAGWRSPLRSTAMIITRSGITAGQTVATTDTPLPPDMLEQPAAVQDIWFARLYLLKPLLVLILSQFWIVSGLVPLLDPSGAAARFGPGFAPQAAMALTIATSLADIALGVSVLWRNMTRRAMIGMLALSLAYLAAGTLIEPDLWLDPLGPLVKVLPSLLLTLVGLAVLEER